MASDENEEVANLLRDAETLLSEGHFEDAAERFSRAAKIAPNDAALFSDWGDALFEQSKFDAANEKYRRAVEIDPNNATIFYNWGVALLEQSKLDEANEKYRRAAEINPNDAAIFYNWGIALFKQSKPDEAVGKYRRAAEIDSNNAAIFYNWGLALTAQSKFAEAVEKYRRAAEIGLNNASLFNNWGLAFAAQSMLGEAIEKYRRAAEIDPNNADVLYNWGDALFAQRQFDDAIEQYRKASDVDSKKSPAYLAWGSALAEQGRYREAIEVTRRIPESDSDYQYACHNIAYLLWKKGEYRASWRAWDKAIVAYRHARATQTRDADFFSYYGQVLHEQYGNLRQAEAVLLQGLAIDPSHTDILTRLGALYTDRYQDPNRERDENWAADFWEARQYFDRAAKELRRRLTAVEDATTLQKLGEVLLESENYGEARTQLERALKLDPEDASLCNSLGVVCSHLEDYHRAADYYEAALRHSPGDLSYWSNLAETYLKLDKRDRAEKEYRKILAIAEDHIDSQVGLGEVYTAMADAGDREFYDVALRHYARAIQLAESGTGSKRVARKELATMYYARGYAAVQAYEGQGALGADESLLERASADFKCCVKNDPEHYKGERAMHKLLDRHKTSSGDWFTRKIAPWLIIVPALAIFVEAQMAHYEMVSLAKIGVGEYSAITFGAMMFIVIGLFLPQIQKLKGAGIELEKSPVNQITTSAALGIKK